MVYGVYFFVGGGAGEMVQRLRELAVLTDSGFCSWYPHGCSQ